MDQSAACACAICCGLPFLIWLITMTVFVFQTNMPACSIQDLYIPALNTKLPNFNSSTTTATFIFFDVELKNVMEEVGVRYEYVDLTFYCGRKTRFPIANYTVPGFYQGHKKTAHLRDVVETRGMPWWDAFAAVSDGSTVALTVELATRVKLKRDFGYSGEKELLLRGDVEVNGYGEKVQKKAVKLRQKVANVVASRDFNLQVVGSEAAVENQIDHAATICCRGYNKITG